MESALIWGFIIVALMLITQRWFWMLFFGIGGLAAAFSTLASIFHFQILWALGFFFLAIICYVIFVVAASS